MDQEEKKTKKKKEKVLKLQEIAAGNSEVINKVIIYINKQLKENLYRDISNNKYTEKGLIKEKSFYKQIINRLLNSLERKSLHIKFLWVECEKGQDLLDMKKASTVQSPSYENEFSKNTGLIPNTYEAKLLSIEEETKRQQKRIIDYQVAVDEFEELKELFSKFIELSPNITGVEVTLKHYIYGNRFCDIAAELCYSEVYYLVKRVTDDLTSILMYSL